MSDENKIHIDFKELDKLLLSAFEKKGKNPTKLVESILKDVINDVSES